jgi:glucokinase
VRHLGLDLGGTNIKLVVLEGDRPNYEISVSSTVPTYAKRGPEGVIQRLEDVARRALDDHGPIESIGVGIPGMFDPVEGTVLLFPNLPGPWAGHPFRRSLEDRLGRRVRLINDARAFTLAEGTLGAGAGCSTLVCITLGTGIGGGVMIDGRLHLGAFGGAGEIAHQTVMPGGPRCGCGNRGCAEALARADVVAAMAGRSTVEEVYAGVVAGDPRCVDAVRTAAGWLGIALANAVTVLGPDRIVVGGGIAAADELVLGPIREAVRARVTLVPTERIEVVAAALGPSAGAIGAALAGAEEPTPLAPQAAPDRSR